jgi:hypothetical protein
MSGIMHFQDVGWPAACVSAERQQQRERFCGHLALVAGLLPGVRTKS